MASTQNKFSQSISLIPTDLTNSSFLLKAHFSFMTLLLWRFIKSSPSLTRRRIQGELPPHPRTLLDRLAFWTQRTAPRITTAPVTKLHDVLSEIVVTHPHQMHFLPHMPRILFEVLPTDLAPSRVRLYLEQFLLRGIPSHLISASYFTHKLTFPSHLFVDRLLLSKGKIYAVLR